jgi:peptide/nickel transport system permease protein
VIGGQCLFRGQNLFALSPAERAAMRGTEIAFVSQEPMVSLDPSFTVGSQLCELVRCNQGLSRSAARTRTLELLDSVRISEPQRVARSYPHQLSGGMAQRVCIAAAIAGEPSLLVADEPTTALDVTVQAEILDLLRALQRDRGMAILLVTHDWGAVSDFCTRAVVLYAGQVVEEGPVAAIVPRPEHPYSAALLAASPERALEGQRLMTIPGNVPHPEEWAASVGCRFSPRCHLSTDQCTAHSIPLMVPSFDRSTRCIRHEGISRDPVESSL